jgi:hypothetical protein
VLVGSDDAHGRETSPSNDRRAREDMGGPNTILSVRFTPPDSPSGWLAAGKLDAFYK